MLYESNYYGVCDLGNSLAHHGIKGQKWGIRRYQNPDGSLTAEGKKRYGTIENLEESRTKQKETAKKVAKVAATAALAATAYAFNKHQSDIANHLMKLSYQKHPVTEDQLFKGPEIVKKTVSQLSTDKTTAINREKLKKRILKQISDPASSPEFKVSMAKVYRKMQLQDREKMRKRREAILRDLNLKNMTMKDLAKYDLY